VGAFRESFPHVTLFSTMGGVDLLMLGSDAPIRFDRRSLDGAMRELRVRLSLARVGIHDAEDLLPLLRVGDAEVARLLAGAVVNSDDNGRVEFRAPKAMRLETIDANAAWLGSAASDPIGYLEPPPGTEEAARLRLAVAEALWRRGEPLWATALARRALEGPRRGEATEMLLRHAHQSP
jgi:hypothetical protein